MGKSQGFLLVISNINYMFMYPEKLFTFWRIIVHFLVSLIMS